MITELKKKEILSVKEMLDLFEAKIGDFKNDMDAIDKKYRELADAEKKELKKNLIEYKSQQKAWQKMFNGFDPDVVKEVLGEDFHSDTTAETIQEEIHSDSTAEAAEPEKEEEIKDMLFPENNEDEVEEEEAVEEEEEETVEETESEDNSSSDFSEWDEEVQEEDKSSESVVEDAPMEDDEWPETIEEWK